MNVVECRKEKAYTGHSDSGSKGDSDGRNRELVRRESRDAWANSAVVNRLRLR